VARIGRRSRSLLKKALISANLATAIAITVFPFWWMVTSSLKPYRDLFSLNPTLIPNTVTFRWYSQVLITTPFISYLKNSAFVALCTTALSLVVSSIGAYSLCRFKYPGRELITNYAFFAYMFPSVAILVPIFQVVIALGLGNTLYSLILAHTTFSLPFCIWMLKGFFESLPTDLEDAALIDGCTKMGAFRRVILPLAGPGIVAAALFSFVLSWNEFLFALIFISTEGLKTMPLGIAGWVSLFHAEWGQMMAASTMSSIPVIIFFFFLQKYMVQGLTAGAVKR